MKLTPLASLALLGSLISFFFAFREFNNGFPGAAGIDIFCAIALLAIMAWQLAKEEEP